MSNLKFIREEVNVWEVFKLIIKNFKEIKKNIMKFLTIHSFKINL
jgi:hypothetical protein